MKTFGLKNKNKKTQKENQKTKKQKQKSSKGNRKGKKEMKKAVAVITLAGMMILAQNVYAAGEHYYVCPKSVRASYWVSVENGAMAAGEELGVEVTFNGPSEADSAKQINMIEDMMVKGVNAIAVSPNDAQAIKPVISDAIADDISVVTFDSDAPESERAYYVGAASDHQIGIEMAAYVAEKIGYEGQVAFMCGGLAAENQVATMEAAKEEFSKYPDIEIVATLASNNDMQKSYENATTLIETYPDLKALLGFTGGQSPAAAQVVEQKIAAGTLKEGQILITGTAFPSNTRQYIENGTIEQVFSWDPAKLGYMAVYAMHAVRNGEEINDGEEFPLTGAVTVEDHKIWTGTLVINKDNVNDYDF